MTSHMVADTSLEHLHGSGVQLVEAAGSSKPQIHKGSRAMESAYVRDCVGRCSQSHSEYEYGECVVDMHIPLIKGTAQVTFKVLDGTESTLSMTVLVANGNKLVFRGENARLITAKGETAPLTSIENDWYLKVLINDSNEFIRIDLLTPCHVRPPSWVRNLSPEMTQREQHVVQETTTTDMGDYETVTKPKDNSSPKQTGAADKTSNTQMLEDVQEPMPKERYQTNAESALSPLEEKDTLSLSRDEEMEVLQSQSSWNEYVMDDAELPPLFEDDADENFFFVSENDSILLRHMDDVVDTIPDKCHRQSHRRNGQPEETSTSRYRRFSTLTKLLMSLLWYSDNYRGEPLRPNQIFKLTVNICRQRIFTLTGLAHEMKGVKVAQKKGKQMASLKLVKKEKRTGHKLLGEASTKEAVADDTANNNTSITSRVSQTTLSDFSKNLQEPSHTETETAIDDQIRSMGSHEIQ